MSALLSRLFAAFLWAVARLLSIPCHGGGKRDTAEPIQTVAGMPAVVDPNNLYSETRPDKLSPVVAKHLQRVYVPNRTSNDVWVIDPATLKVVDKFKVGINPQHVVPSWDLKTLWVNNNAEGRTRRQRHADRPAHRQARQKYSRRRSLQHVFHAGRQRRDRRRRSAQAARLPRSADDGDEVFDRHAATAPASTTPTFPSTAATRSSPASSPAAWRRSIWSRRKVVGYLKLSKGGMPQDVRISPDGKVFYVADMKADGVFIVDGDKFTRDRPYQNRHRHARPLPEPRRQEALRRQPRRRTRLRPAQRQRQRQRDRLRDAKSRSDLADPRRRQSRTWATSASTANSSGSPAATTTRSTSIDTDQRQRQKYSRENRAARPHRLAATGTVLPRPHRQLCAKYFLLIA